MHPNGIQVPRQLSGATRRVRSCPFSSVFAADTLMDPEGLNLSDLAFEIPDFDTSGCAQLADSPSHRHAAESPPLPLAALAPAASSPCYAPSKPRGEAEL
ncbi:hypothetical protein T484DRAFT_1892053 [Baffinella frigidus]|nr:hypothetical protein T484DRAFT_1892053 [Cryptophyta sp. CCMP2293]